MSYLFNFSDTNSILTADISPPLYLEQNKEYGIGLLYVTGTNSLDNITSYNNNFKVGFKIETKVYEFKISVSPGIYEFRELVQAIRRDLKLALEKIFGTSDTEFNKIIDASEKINITVDNNTQLCTINSFPFAIFFPKEKSLGSVLGFPQTNELNPLLIPNNPSTTIYTRVGSESVHMVTNSAIHIHCNLVEKAYINGKLTHLLYSLPMTEASGFTFNKSPKDIIYLPITTKLISRIELELRNQSDHLLDFKKDLITIFLHLKQL